MKMIVRPSDLSSRRLPNSSSTSCGTSTAVGSSRIRILAPAVEHLEDLHPLPGPDAQGLDQCAGVDQQAVAAGQLVDLRPGTLDVQPAAGAHLLGAEHDVLPDGQVVGEHEVLVHHADSDRDRVGRRVEGDLAAVDLDGALVRLMHAVQRLHQRGFAGAVLPHQRVHGAAPDGDVDVGVRHHPGKPLGDPGQIRRRRRPSAVAPILRAPAGAFGSAVIGPALRVVLGRMTPQRSWLQS